MTTSPRIRSVPIPPSRFRGRVTLKPYVDAMVRRQGQAIIVPLNGSLLGDIRASLYTLTKRQGWKVHVYRGAKPTECIAWVEPR